MAQNDQHCGAPNVSWQVVVLVRASLWCNTSTSVAMSMPMMQIWKVRMLMTHRRVMVPVGVRLSCRISRAMGVLVMRVVHVAVFMVQRLVIMLMLMSFRQERLRGSDPTNG